MKEFATQLIFNVCTGSYAQCEMPQASNGFIRIIRYHINFT